MSWLLSDASSNFPKKLTMHFPTVPVDDVPQSDSPADSKTHRPLVQAADDEPLPQAQLS